MLHKRSSPQSSRVSLAATADAPDLHRSNLIYQVLGLVLVLWAALAWLGSGYYSANMADQAYREGDAQAHQQLDGITGEIDGALRILRNVPRILAGEDAVQEHLSQFGPQAGPSRREYEDRKRLWTANGERSGLHNFLLTAAAGLDAEVIWVVNAAGDCIASSNADKPASFVGTNYGEREYFRQSRNGQAGQQYAVGKVTGVPGLFYSYPVLNDKKQFIGAVVVKRDISDFLRWTRPNNAFIADANGVVVLTEDKALAYRVMPGGSLDSVPAAIKLARYKTQSIATVDIQQWNDARYPGVVSFGHTSSPVVLTSKSVADGNIKVYVP